MVHSLEEKLEVIKMHKQGAGVKLLAKRFCLSRSLINVWLEQYKQHGVAGLQRLPYNCRYNFEEKCQIVCEIDKKHVPLHSIYNFHPSINQQPSSYMQALCKQSIVGD